MAWIRKGKHAGKEVNIRQFCNDWFQVDGLPHRDSIRFYLCVCGAAYNLSVALEFPIWRCYDCGRRVRTLDLQPRRMGEVIW